LIDQHGSQVPRTRDELQALPGVGRKTANVVLNTAFGEETLAVDTHVFRVSNRTGLAPGKTVDEVAEDIKKKLDEYIIEPQITVTLDKVGSARYSVLGKVASPGIKVMNRRYNLYEAIAEAGGIDKEGDKGRILLVRLDPQGGLSQTVFDLNKMMKGQTEVPYLVPGDQIIIPEKRWSVAKILSAVGQASMLRVLFGVPF